MPAVLQMEKLSIKAVVGGLYLLGFEHKMLVTVPIMKYQEKNTYNTGCIYCYNGFWMHIGKCQVMAIFRV